MTVTLLEGDCLALLPTLRADSFDSCVTDPPYHLTSIGRSLQLAANGDGTDRTQQRNYQQRGFMGKPWDGGDVAFRPETWAEVLRVLKPGGHMLAFGGTRTAHRMTCAIEDAGFEIRDSISYLYDGGLPGHLLWCYGSGFPKSRDVSKDLNGTRCLCSVRGAASIQASSASRSVLQHGLRGIGETEAEPAKDLHDMHGDMATDNPQASIARDDLFASLRSGGNRPVPSGNDTETQNRMCEMRGNGEGPAAVEGEEAGECLLQPVLQSEVSNAPARSQWKRPREEAARDWHERATEPGMERRVDLQAVEGELQGRTLGAVPCGSSDDADGERLHPGTSVGDGPMGRAPANPNGVCPPPRPRLPEQPAPQLRTLAEQSESQDGGAWHLCGRCGKPRIPEGIGTALKPAFEPIILARKPLEGTVAANTLRHGCGGLNINSCRISAADKTPAPVGQYGGSSIGPSGHSGLRDGSADTLGRWPANLILSYPENEYILKPDVTDEQRRELYRFLHENS